MDKGINSKECNLLDIEGFKEYDQNYGNLEELYGNEETKGFVNDKYIMTR